MKQQGSEQPIFSARSQRSFEQQFDLERQVHRCATAIARCEKKIAELETSKARLLNEQLKGVAVRLHDTLTELEDENRVLAALKEERARLQKQIEELRTVTPEELAARTPTQQKLVQLAAERLKQDRLAGEAVETLRGILARRNALTAQMAECAARVEFHFIEDGLDKQRFDALSAALPADLAARSERWHGWFTGARKDTQPYIVRDECLIVPETLAQCGVYYFGERIELTADEADELLREDRRAPTQDVPWRVAPPSVLTVEAYDAALAEAKEQGIALEQILFWRDVAQEQRAKQTYRSPNYDRAQQQAAERHKAGFESVDLANVEPMVKLKALSPIRTNGKTVPAGAIFEIAQRGAWSLLRSGAAARP